GGTRGPAVVAGNPSASLLYKLVAREAEPAMPPGQNRHLSNDAVSKSAASIQAGEPDDTPFDDHVHPADAANAAGWHGPNNVKRASLDLSTREMLLRGGDSGPAIVPGDAKSSLLMKRIRHEVEPGMPFKADKLREDVIARIADWINAGAAYSEKKLAASG